MFRKMGILALLLAGTLVPAACLAKPPAAACRAHGEAALQAWTHGHYGRMNQYFAPAVADHFTPKQWQAAWAQVQAAFGALRSAGDFTPHTLAGQQVLVAPMSFARAPMAMLVQCDAKDRVTTFRVVPASVVPGLVKATPVPLPVGAVQRDLEVPTPLGPLPGKLLLPAGKGPFPAVVLVQGSGSLDYNETVGPNKPFRDFAYGLAKLGVASLRYDKRSYVYGKAMQGKPVTVDDNVTDDAVTALHMLAREKNVDPRRIFVLGHSLGAMMAPRIGQRDRHLAGVIMLAAPARSMLEVLAWQFRELGGLSGQSTKQIAQQESGVAAERKLLDQANPAHPPKGRYFHAPQSFWMSLHEYQQVAVAKKLTLPVLILQGEDDLNVSYKLDFGRWQQALAGHANVTFHAFPGLSHLFMPARKTAVAVDMTPGHVSPTVIADIATWIRAQPPVK